MHKKFREGKPFHCCIDFHEKTSDLSGDSKNDNLSTKIDIIGSSKSTDSSNHTTDSAEQVKRTPNNMWGISDIPISRSVPAPTGYTQEGVQRLRQIQELGPTILPDRSFMDELSGVRAFKQPRMQTDP